MLTLVLWATSAGAQVVDENLWSVDPGARVLAIARSGNTLYIGGSFLAVGPSTGAGALVNTRDGAPVGPYPKVAGEVLTVTADGSGGWFIGGIFAGVGGLRRKNLAHILAGGTVADWDPSPDGPIVALALSGNTLYVGGDFWRIGGEARRSLAAFDVETGGVTAWDPQPTAGDPRSSEYGTVWTILLHGHSVYVGGSFAGIGGQPRKHLAALDAKTGRATPWDPRADSWVRALAIHGNTLFAGGVFFHVGGKLRKYLAAIDLKTGEATPWDARVTRVPDFNYDGGPRVLALEVVGNTLYVAGAFSSIGGEPRGSLAALDVKTGAATSWDPQALGWGPGRPEFPHFDALVVHEHTVYVTGAFRSLGGREGGYYGRGYAGAVDARTGLATPWDPRPNGEVVALAVSGSTIYVGGVFNNIRDWVPRRGLAALDLTTGAVTPWDPNCDGLVRSIAVSGNTIYVAGQFSTVAGQARANLAALDAADGTATTWSPNPNGPLWALAVNGSAVYAGGWFSRIGGQPRSYLAALDSATGGATAWNPGANDIVMTLAVDGNVVYAGGFFSHIGGQHRQGMAALDATTGAATLWTANADGPVNDLAVGGSAVYAGGYFNYINGKPRDGIAALDLATGSPTAWIANASRSVLALAVSGNTVYAGGGFSSIGGAPRNGIAALDAETGAVLPWNPEPGWRNAGGVVWSLAAYGNTVYAGGLFERMGVVPSAGIAAITVADPPVVGAPDASKAPSFVLAQNRPNPVYSRTAIEFTLPAAGPVSLAVYDLQGRRVASLLDHEPQPAGAHEVPVRTEGWRSGFYLYRLEVGRMSATRKMVVLK
jgi:hypothetical protein